MKKKGLNWLGLVLIIIGLAVIVSPQIFPLSALETGQLTSQGRFEGRINNYAATVTQDLTFQFSSSLASNFAGQNFPATIIAKIDGQQFKSFGYTIQIINDGMPHPVYPVKPLELQSVYSIPFSEIKQFGNGKHTMTFVLQNPFGAGTEGEISFEVWIDSEACNNLNSRMEVYEAFSAGQVLTKDSLRWQLQGFCYQRPLRITSLNGTILRQSLEEYSLLLNNSSMTVPVGEVWVFTYIAGQTPDIAVVCPEGSVYNETNGNCVISPPVVFSCSGNGIFDVESQSCVIQAESRIVCEGGIGVYNSQEQKCVYFVPEGETEVICPPNSTITVSEQGIKKCVFEGKIEYVCNAGHLNTTTQTCQVNPVVEQTQIELGLGKKISFPILAIGILFIIIGTIILFKRK